MLSAIHGKTPEDDCSRWSKKDKTYVSVKRPAIIREYNANMGVVDLCDRMTAWSDMTSVDTITQWREDWSSASVVNHTIVTDPTIRQPGYDLPRRTWSLLNRFRTGQGPCRANLHKWGLAQSPSCDCGQRQTMNHIVDTCPLTKFEGGLNLLHEADDDAVMWLESTATAALAK